MRSNMIFLNNFCFLFLYINCDWSISMQTDWLKLNEKNGNYSISDTKAKKKNNKITDFAQSGHKCPYELIQRQLDSFGKQCQIQKIFVVLGIQNSKPPRRMESDHLLCIFNFEHHLYWVTENGRQKIRVSKNYKSISEYYSKRREKIDRAEATKKKSHSFINKNRIREQ